MYTYNYYKKNLISQLLKKISFKYKNGETRANLSLNELRLIAEHRNISNYEK